MNAKCFSRRLAGSSSFSLTFIHEGPVFFEKGDGWRCTACGGSLATDPLAPPEAT